MHTSLRPIDPQSPYLDSYHLAYERARNVMKHLVEQEGIDPRRIRLTVAGPNELAHIGVDPNKMKFNSRVEVTMLDELVNDLWGAEEEQRVRYTPAGP